MTAGLARPTRVLLTLAAAGVAAGAIWAGRDVLAPVLLAAVLVIVVHPVRRPFDRRGNPSWVGTTVVIALAFAILIGLAVIVVLALGQFARVLADYSDDLESSSAAVVDFFGGLGFDPHTAGSVASTLQPSAILHAAFAIGSTLLALGGALFFVFAYVLYLAIDGARFREFPASLSAAMSMRVEAFRAFAGGTSRYFAVNTVFGAIVAVVDGLVLWGLGVPAPFVWAVLAFVTNYIPNVGFVIGVIPPFVLALAVGGWGLGLLVLGLYCLVNVVIQVLIQPRFVAHTVRLSVTLTFFSVVLWTVLLGPVGAILAVPMSLLVRFLLIGDDPDARLARWLTGEREPVSPTPPAAPDTPGRTRG